MPQILRTVLQPDTPRAADAVGVTLDLPVNPLSVILFTIKALNDTGTVANYRSYLTLIDAITNVVVKYRGASVLAGDLRDLAVMTAILTGWQPQQLNMGILDNDVRAITVPLVFGRVPYSPDECFPATRRGDLTLSFDTDILDTGYDGLITQIETIELLDAQPSQFLKQTTTERILDAAGDFDIELPIGNDVLGVLLRGATVPNTAFDASIGQLALMVDNVEMVYSLTNWETLHGDLARRIPSWRYDSHKHNMSQHTHNVSVKGGLTLTAPLAIDPDSNAGVFGKNAAGDRVIPGATFGIGQATPGTTLEPMDEGGNLEPYAFLDFDPLKDGQFALKTEGAGRVNLRVTSDVTDTAASKFMPVELVEVAQAGVAPAGV